MKNYLVEYRVVGVQTVLVSNCKSKKDAIQAAKEHDPFKAEPIDFSVDKVLWSTCTAFETKRD